MTLRYVCGDATRPEGTGPRVIVHCCNTVGAWGAGFVTAVSRRWPLPERRYRAWHGDLPNGTNLPLGAVQFVDVEPTITVANLIGQKGVGRGPDGEPSIRYPAIRTGLANVRAFARERGASVHMPRMGAGLAGGDWARIEHLVHDELVSRGVAVTVYDLPF